MKTNHTQQTRVFGVILIAIEITMGFIYGFFVDYSRLTTTLPNFIVIVSVMLALLGKMFVNDRFWTFISVCG